jgi:hypothetical protein
MKMRHVRFTVHSDEEMGGVGIIPLIYRNWESFTPSTMPGHDLIDHTTKEEGKIWQELRALGANLYIENWQKKRYRFFSTKDSLITWVGKDMGGESLQNILEDSDYEDIPMAPQVKLTKEEEGNFQEFWHGFRWGTINAEQNDYLYGGTFEWYKKHKKEILSWFRYGYANAKRRYKGEPKLASYAKEKLNKVVEKAMPILEEYADTGEVFTLSFDFWDGYAKISHRWII